MDKRSISQCIEDAIHAVFHRQDKTGGQLSQATTGIHQGRGIWQKFKLGHHLVKNILHFPDTLLLGVVFFFSFGNVMGHPSEHLLRGLDDVTMAVFLKISSSQDSSGVIGEDQSVDNKDRLVQPRSEKACSIRIPSISLRSFFR